jgi:hypothetical protein
MQGRETSRAAKVLKRVPGGRSDANIDFDDLRSLLNHLGFAERVRRGHHIFTRDGVPEILNLQPRGHEAKAYQVRQVREILIARGLAEDSDRGTTGDRRDIPFPEETEDDG